MVRKPPKPRFMRVSASRLAFALVCALVIYFSWKPSPFMVKVPLLPAVVGRWFEQHDSAKNLIGYGIFGLTGFTSWSTRLRGRSTPRIRSVWLSCNDPILLVCFFSVVVILELGQLALPHRTCDLADVLAGWTGILLAWAIFCLGRFMLDGPSERCGRMATDGSSQVLRPVPRCGGRSQLSRRPHDC
jgi:hypothetical protein